jgi:hypothetical protein
MKRTLALASAAALTALIGITAPAQASGKGAEQSSIKCGNVIVFQEGANIAAGGGPKVGIPAPVNCDHYFQIIGLIGNQ